MSTRIIDISPEINDRLGVFPGDTKMSREVLLRREDGAPVTLSTLRATVHLGAHVDGVNHYGTGAPGVEASPLELFIGRAQVISTSVERGQRITKEMLSAPISEQRVLLRTGTFPDPHNWNEDFAGLDPALVDYLGEQGVRLIGIDTPSVDLQDSKDLVAHAACLRKSIHILEGIVLGDAPDGVYELVAMPLRLLGFDASPVRAILREIGDEPKR
jgi:arylformamidase